VSRQAARLCRCGAGRDAHAGALAASTPRGGEKPREPWIPWAQTQSLLGVPHGLGEGVDLNTGIRERGRDLRAGLQREPEAEGLLIGGNGRAGVVQIERQRLGVPPQHKGVGLVWGRPRRRGEQAHGPRVQRDGRPALPGGRDQILALGPQLNARLVKQEPVTRTELDGAVELGDGARPERRPTDPGSARARNGTEPRPSARLEQRHINSSPSGTVVVPPPIVG